MIDMQGACGVFLAVLGVFLVADGWMYRKFTKKVFTETTFIWTKMSMMDGRIPMVNPYCEPNYYICVKCGKIKNKEDISSYDHIYGQYGVFGVCKDCNDKYGADK